MGPCIAMFGMLLVFLLLLFILHRTLPAEESPKEPDDPNTAILLRILSFVFRKNGIFGLMGILGTSGFACIAAVCGGFDPLALRPLLNDFYDFLRNPYGAQVQSK